MTPSVQIAGGRRTTRWTRETIIEKIREWDARHGAPPSSADWNPSLARWRAQEWRIERYRRGHWPSTNAVKRHFDGSFDAAVLAAGLEPARPGPRRTARAAKPAVDRSAERTVSADVERLRAELAEARADLAEAEARARAAERPDPGPLPADAAGPAVLASALRRLAEARARGDRMGLVRALGEVSAAASDWRDRM